MAGGLLTAGLVAAITAAVKRRAPAALVVGAVALAAMTAPEALGDEYADCLRKYQWKPRLKSEKCVKPETAAAEETAAAPAQAPAGADAAEAGVDAAVAGQEIGSTTVVIKTVTGAMAGDVRQLALKDGVHQNEVIETDVSSASEIIFLDDTKISLGPNTRLSLDNFVFDPDPARGKFVLTTVKGVFRFVSGNLSNESYEIRTPTVTIGVRGTVFTSVTRDDGTTVVILECPVCRYRWQPETQRQCLRQHPSSLTVETAIGDLVELNQCGLSTTIFSDGTATEPGPPPDWAVAALAELDGLVSEPR